MDLGEQRAIQDWYVKFALQNVEGVAEIASFGGYQKQYQVTVDTNKLTYYNIPLSKVIESIRANNDESGGRKFDMSDNGYIINTEGCLKRNLNKIQTNHLAQVQDLPI